MLGYFNYKKSFALEDKNNCKIDIKNKPTLICHNGRAGRVV
jgi:hypothetical protein